MNRLNLNALRPSSILWFVGMLCCIHDDICYGQDYVAASLNDSVYMEAFNQQTAAVTRNSNHQQERAAAASSSLSSSASPSFDNSTQRSLIAAVGRTTKLYCRVRNLGDRAVSWIRKRDLHILTIGVMTYTNDQRFEAHHFNETDEWMLKIVSVQPRDAGIYECQISTEPKISQAYRLTVVVAKAKILANPELVFKSGSDINLTCIAQQAPGPPSYIYWYKDGDLINYSQRGGINVVTERLTKTSKLLIARVVPTDSGNYTCTPSNSNSDSVYVHVINKEHPAAMQHESASKERPGSVLLLAMITVIASYFICYTLPYQSRLS